LVVGGGAGGCSIAAKYATKLGKNKVIIIDPADVSYCIDDVTQDHTSEHQRDKNVGFHCSVVEASVLLECDTVSPHN
jgi:NADH dehydrogenase FAD-containing subunit